MKLSKLIPSADKLNKGIVREFKIDDQSIEVRLTSADTHEFTDRLAVLMRERFKTNPSLRGDQATITDLTCRAIGDVVVLDIIGIVDDNDNPVLYSPELGYQLAKMNWKFYQFIQREAAINNFESEAADLAALKSVPPLADKVG